MTKIVRIVWNSFDKIVRFTVSGFLKLLKIKLDDEKMNKFMQFVKFCVVGLSNTFISWVVYYLFIIFGAHWLIGSIMGFVVSVLNAFYWNNKYVFKKANEENRNNLVALFKTFLAYAFSGLILNNILMWLWIDVLGISEYITPIINLFITTPINFAINKLWAFRGKNEETI